MAVDPVSALSSAWKVKSPPLLLRSVCERAVVLDEPTAPPLRLRRVKGAPSANASWRAVWLDHRRVQGAVRRTLGAGVLLGVLFWDDLRPPGGAGDSPLRLQRAKSALPLAPPWSAVWLGRLPLPLAPTLSHCVRTAVIAWFERSTPFPREGSPLKCLRVVVGLLARSL